MPSNMNPHPSGTIPPRPCVDKSGAASIAAHATEPKSRIAADCEIVTWRLKLAVCPSFSVSGVSSVNVVTDDGGDAVAVAVAESGEVAVSVAEENRPGELKCTLTAVIVSVLPEVLDTAKAPAETV